MSRKIIRNRLTIVAYNDCPAVPGFARVGKASTEQREERGVLKNSHRLTMLRKGSKIVR
jgi:hypothetical protein